MHKTQNPQRGIDLDEAARYAQRKLEGRPRFKLEPLVVAHGLMTAEDARKRPQLELIAALVGVVRDGLVPMEALLGVLPQNTPGRPEPASSRAAEETGREPASEDGRAAVEVTLRVRPVSGSPLWQASVECSSPGQTAYHVSLTADTPNEAAAQVGGTLADAQRAWNEDPVCGQEVDERAQLSLF